MNISNAGGRCQILTLLTLTRRNDELVLTASISHKECP